MLCFIVKYYEEKFSTFTRIDKPEYQMVFPRVTHLLSKLCVSFFVPRLAGGDNSAVGILVGIFSLFLCFYTSVFGIGLCVEYSNV